MKLEHGTLVLVMSQAGEGCDYTIGCGTTYAKLKATEPAAADEEAKKIIEDMGCLKPLSERSLETAYIMRVERMLPIQKWYRDAVDEAERLEREDHDAKDKAEYDRLRAKFGSA